MKRTRIIIGLILLVLLIAGIAYSQSQPPPPSNRKHSATPQSQTKSDNQTANKDKRGTDTTPFIVTMADTPESKARADQASEHQNKEATNSRLLVWITGVLAFVAFLQWCIMIWQSRQLKRSIDYLPTIERAYIYVFISADVENWKRTKEDELSPLQIEVRNYGKTPARLTSIFIKRQIYEIKDSKHEPLESDLDIIIDAPNRFVASGVPETFSQDIRIYALVNGWDNFGDGNYYIEYSGDVRYKDIFNDNHIASFSWILYSRNYQRGFYISEADKNYTT